MLIMVGTAVVRLATLDRAPLAGASAPVTEASPSAPEPTTAAVTPTPTASRSPSPEPTTPAPTSSSPGSPPPLTMSAQAQLCTAPNQLTVTATASVALAQAEVFYEFPPGSPTRQRPMSVSGPSAQATFADWQFAPEVRWWVQARSTDGRTVTTPEVLTFMEAC